MRHTKMWVHEARYIVAESTSIDVVRYMSKSEAYEEAVVGGRGTVEWYSALDGYKNPSNLDDRRKDRTQRLYCNEECFSILYTKDGDEFEIFPYEEIDNKNIPSQAEVSTIICGDSCGFSFWTEGRIKIFVTFSDYGIIETYRLGSENDIAEKYETEIFFEDLQSEEEYNSVDRAEISGTLEWYRKQEAENLNIN